MRALWIEMRLYAVESLHHASRPVRALWIEMYHFELFAPGNLSRPVRALWIEIILVPFDGFLPFVEAREGLVD